MAITAVIPALVSANLNKFFYELSIARNITNTEWEVELLEEGKTIDFVEKRNDYPAFDLSCKIDDCNELKFCLTEKEVVVIGNIYENPEIMEKNK